MDKKDSIKVIKRFVEKLGKDYNIEKIIFFGSRTTNKYHKDSDIDLIIVSKDFEGVNRILRGANMYQYWDALIPVDFLCYTPKEFNLLKKKITIAREAIKNGIIID